VSSTTPKNASESIPLCFLASPNKIAALDDGPDNEGIPGVKAPAAPAPAAPVRLESVSRFNRFSSERISEAL
jgi:hypothetical protein